METRLSRFISRYSRREQIALLAITACSMPFLYLSLDLPKTIINEAIGGSDFPQSLFGRELEQVPYLVVLCVTFLALVMINGALKYVINVYKGVVGERMLRRLRYQLFETVLRFPPHQFRRTSQGEVVSMITAETEPLGGFVGDAVAVPAFQGGTLLTILVFMFVQDWVLGVAAITLYPLQMWLIPKLQRRVNVLRKERIVKVRSLSERIGEVVGGIDAVHANAVAQLELADFSDRAGGIFEVRFAIYKLKFLIKFLNNFIAQVTPFFFYLIGGYLVIKGDLSFGALVAVLAAYKDLAAPWKELLNYYQRASDVRVKYDLLCERFMLPDLVDERILDGSQQEPLETSGELVARNVTLGEPDGSFSAITSFRVPLPAHVAILGPPGGGKELLAGMLGGIVRSPGGTMQLGSVDLLKVPQSVLGRSIGYAGREPRLRAGTLIENLTYGLQRYPVDPHQPGDADVEARRVREATLSGNSVHVPRGNWIDLDALGIADRGALTERALDVLGQVGMDKDVLELGLRTRLAAEDKGLARQLVEARNRLRERLDAAGEAGLVEPFDRDSYNNNLSIAENIVFGAPRDRAGQGSLTPQDVACGGYASAVLSQLKLDDDLAQIGLEVAKLMVELFGEMEASDELVQRFSFISVDELPEFRVLVSRIDRDGIASLDAEQRASLIALAMRLEPARHRLGMVDDSLRARLLEARALFAAGLVDAAATPEGVSRADLPTVDFFDREHYNAAVSVQDNILFGRIVYGRARADQAVGAHLREVIDELGLERTVAKVGLETQVGIGGSRLSSLQRQKVNIARALLKSPSLLVLDDATAGLDPRSAALIIENVLAEFAGKTVFWTLQDAETARRMDRVLLIEQGQVVENGLIDELDHSGTQTHTTLVA